MRRCSGRGGLRELVLAGRGRPSGPARPSGSPSSRARCSAPSTTAVLRYQGIPYAAPPVGELRWQPPQPAAGWTEDRDATAPGRALPAARRRPRHPARHRGQRHRGLPHAERDARRPAPRRPPAPGAGVDPRRRLQRRRRQRHRPAPAGRGRAADRGHRQLPARHAWASSACPGCPGPVRSGCWTSSRRCAGCSATSPRSAATRTTSRSPASRPAPTACARSWPRPGRPGCSGGPILQSGGCSTANIIDVIRPGTGPGGRHLEAAAGGRSRPGRRTATQLGCRQAGHGRWPACARLPVAT